MQINFYDDHFIWKDHIKGIDKPVLWEYKNKEKCFYQWPLYKRSDYKILIELTKDQKKIALGLLRGTTQTIKRGDKATQQRESTTKEGQ